MMLLFDMCIFSFRPAYKQSKILSAILSQIMFFLSAAAFRLTRLRHFSFLFLRIPLARQSGTMNCAVLP
jgi:hypothetical protein